MAKTVALIMAGGGGARLWPASGPDRPKQLIPGLAGDAQKTLLRATLDRVADWADETLIVTTEAMASAIEREAPELPSAAIIAEPEGKNTAPCVALAIQALLGTHPEQTCLAILPADHHIRDEAAFRARLDTARSHALAANTVCTLGIEPDHAATGYGYLEHDGQAVAGVDGDHGLAVFAAKRFVEKPDALTAAAYLDSGRYLWNAGIFVAPLARLAADFDRCAGRTFRALADVRTAAAAGDLDARDRAARAGYVHVVAEPIDIAVMEKLSDIRVVPSQVGWTDLGSWASVAATFQADSIARLGPGRVELSRSDGCLVWTEDSQNTVALVGCRDLAVVVVGKTVLVCPLDQAQAVREMAKRFDS